MKCISKRNLSNLRRRRKILKCPPPLKLKMPSKRLIILDSFQVTELKETPLLAKRTNGASQVSTLDVVRIFQSRE